MFDEEVNLTFGLDVAESLQKTLRSSSSVVIAILSKSALASQWFLKEIALAGEMKKCILAISIEPIPRNSLPATFNYLNVVPYDSIQSDPGQFIHLVKERIIEEKESTLRQEMSTWSSEDEDMRIIEPRRKTSPMPSTPSKEEKRSHRKQGKTWLIPVMVLLILAGGLFLYTFNTVGDAVSPSEDLLVIRLGTQNTALKWTVFIMGCILISVLFIAFGVKKRLKKEIASMDSELKKASVHLDVITDAKTHLSMDDREWVIKQKEPLSLILEKGEHQINLDYSQYNQPQRISIFIAGSTNLQAERDALRATISIVYNRWKEKSFQILSYTFEDFDRKFTKDGQQSLYDYFIEHEASYAVFLIKGDVGTFTLKEFEKACKAYLTTGHPAILVYNTRDGDVSSTASALKDKVNALRQYWIDYSDLNELRYHFLDTLSTELWNLYEKELLSN